MVMISKCVLALLTIFEQFFFTHPIGIKTKNLSIFFFGLPPQKRTFIEIERTFYITNKIKIHRKTFFFMRGCIENILYVA